MWGMANAQASRGGLEQLPGLYFTGNAFGGVGIPFCIHKSEKVAEKAAAQLKDASPAT